MSHSIWTHPMNPRRAFMGILCSGGYIKCSHCCDNLNVSFVGYRPQPQCLNFECVVHTPLLGLKAQLKIATERSHWWF